MCFAEASTNRAAGFLSASRTGLKLLVTVLTHLLSIRSNQLSRLNLSRQVHFDMSLEMSLDMLIMVIHCQCQRHNCFELGGRRVLERKTGHAVREKVLSAALSQWLAQADVRGVVIFIDIKR